MCVVVLNLEMTEETLHDRLLRAHSEGKLSLREGFWSPAKSIPDSLEYSLMNHSVWLRTEGRFGERLVLSRNKRNSSCRDNIYSRRKMDGLNFEKGHLHNVTFSWCNLRLATFAGAKLKDVTFEQCDLEGTEFGGAIFDNVTFKDCLDVEKAYFDRVRYTPADQHPQNEEPSFP